MTKQNSKSPKLQEATSKSEAELLLEDQGLNDQEIVQQIIDKAAGAIPYESDDAVIRAKMLEANREPRIVESLDELDAMSVAPSNLQRSLLG